MTERDANVDAGLSALGLARAHLHGDAAGFNTLMAQVHDDRDHRCRVIGMLSAFAITMAEGVAAANGQTIDTVLDRLTRAAIRVGTEDDEP